MKHQDLDYFVRKMLHDSMDVIADANAGNRINMMHYKQLMLVCAGLLRESLESTGEERTLEIFKTAFNNAACPECEKEQKVVSIDINAANQTRSRAD